jgi:hypothetical protein
MDIARRGIRRVEHQNFSIDDPGELLFGPEEEKVVERSRRPLTFVGVVLAILPYLKKMRRRQQALDGRSLGSSRGTEERGH